MTLPITAPFATQKMDGGRNRDGHGFGPYATSTTNFGIVFHTTETVGVPSYLRTGPTGTYSVAPHFTYLPSNRQWIQHTRLDCRSGTLSGASTLENGKKVPTNGAKVIQVEIACYSSKATADKYGRLWVYNLSQENLADLAGFVAWCHVNFAVPLIWYPKKSVTKSIPMSHGEWWYDRTWGITDHSTSPDESTHWDCGAMRTDKIMELVTPTVPMKPSNAIIDRIFAQGLAQPPEGAAYWKGLSPWDSRWQHFKSAVSEDWWQAVMEGEQPRP